MTRLVALLFAALALAAAASTASASVQQAKPCTEVRLGVLAPLSGKASFVGAEQLSWARYAVATYNDRFETKFSTLEADSELTAEAATEAARTLVDDKTVYGVVGGATGQSVRASGPAFARASLASVSGSATGAGLTGGANRTFFRVVPSDATQAPTIAGYVAGKLAASRVLVLHREADAYSTTLARSLTGLLDRRSVTVSQRTLRAGEDLGAVAGAVPASTDLVIFATSDARGANTLARELAERGTRARVFGTDVYSPDQFKPRSGFTSAFATDLRIARSTSTRSLVTRYDDFSNGRSFGTFGPPSYVAAWVLMEAIRGACRDRRLTRAEVVERVRATDVPSILGGRVRFTPNGEVVGGRFAIFEIRDGTYRPAI